MQTVPELLFQIESDMLRETITYLNKGKSTPALWRAERLRDANKLNNYNVALIKKYNNAILNGSTSKALDAQKTALNKIDTIYSKAIERGIDIAPPQDKISPTVKAITEQYANHGLNDMNYTMQSLLNGVNSIYKETIEQTTLRYALGDITLDDALKRTCSKWISQGGVSILDSAGRNWTPESYSRMVLLTNNRNITTNVQLERNKEYGNDLIEISSHAGAREGCAPYQGKIYSQTGANKDYPPLSSTSYGEPAGLGGINCHHDFYCYIPGVSAKRFDPQPFDEKEYKVTQTQRKLERDIRNNKRKLELQKLTGNEAGIARANNSVKAAQSQMRSFIDKTGRTRYYNRERIFT